MTTGHSSLSDIITPKHIAFAKKNGVTITLPDTSNATTWHPVIVVLLGWMGSSPRMLRHYVNVYTELGYPVVSYIPSGLQFASQYLQSNYVKSVLETLLNLDCLKEKQFQLYIHAMSNNGGIFYGEMISVMSANGSKYKPLMDQIVATCAEAFPGCQNSDIRICSVLSGTDLTAAGGPKKKTTVLDWFNPVSWFIFFVQIIAWLYFFTGIFLGGSSFDALSGKLKNPAAKWPVLALFTEGDFVVPADQIKHFWSTQVKHSVELCQIDGKHINHIQGLVKAPDQYKIAIRSFLQKHVEKQ